MPLRDLQTALGMLVLARASGARLGAGAWESLDGLSLSTEERAWLDQLTGSPGFDITCYIQRWWRETRLQYAAPLTLAALGSDKRAEVLQSYLDQVPPPSLFFAPEALGFLDFVIRAAPQGSHLEAIARFERAMRVAAEAALMSPRWTPDLAELRPTQTIKRDPAASIMEFAAPPEKLLGALLLGQSLPSSDGHVYLILTAPGLPYWWRPATQDEGRLFACCQPSATIERLLAEVNGAGQPLYDLLRDGALGLDQ
ncbi:MAG: hypothetical protein HY314_04240 [Acidobacteria bacterium]|nr:hypothetical protein [Acidobacteriota bacterium]